MLKHLSISAGFLALGAALLVVNDYGREPALGVTLTLGDLQQDLKLGEPFELKLGGVTYRGKLEGSPTRLFDKRGVSFEYPAGFAFEYDPDPDVTIFSVEGPDTLIVLQVFPIEKDAEELCRLVMESIAEEFGGFNVVLSDIDITLDGEELQGVQLNADMAGVTLVQRGYGLALDGATAVLFLQGTLAENGKLEPESLDTIELVTKTFSFK